MQNPQWRPQLAGSATPTPARVTQWLWFLLIIAKWNLRSCTGLASSLFVFKADTHFILLLDKKKKLNIFMGSRRIQLQLFFKSLSLQIMRKSAGEMFHGHFYSLDVMWWVMTSRHQGNQTHLCGPAPRNAPPNRIWKKCYLNLPSGLVLSGKQKIQHKLLPF